MPRAHAICCFAALTMLVACKGKEDATRPSEPSAVVDEPETSITTPIMGSLPSEELAPPPKPDAEDLVSHPPPAPCPEPASAAVTTPKRPQKVRTRARMATKASLAHSGPDSLGQPQSKPRTALEAAQAQEASLGRNPWRVEQVNPLLIALYGEAMALQHESPDSAMARIDFALRFCQDAAFYALGAEILLRQGHLYRSQVLAERATLYPTGFSPDAAKTGYKIQAQVLKKVMASAPSNETEERFHRLAAAFHLRYHHPLSEENGIAQ